MSAALGTRGEQPNYSVDAAAISSYRVATLVDSIGDQVLSTRSASLRDALPIWLGKGEADVDRAALGRAHGMVAERVRELQLADG